MKCVLCVIVFVLVGGVLTTAVLADTIVLKNGKKLTGRIIGSSPKNTVIKLKSGQMKSIRAEEIDKVTKDDEGMPVPSIAAEEASVAADEVNAATERPPAASDEADSATTEADVERSEPVAPPRDPEVRLLGLEIGTPLSQEDREGVASGVPRGTVLHIQITQPDRVILNVDDNASKLNHFTDEKNTNLQKPTEGMTLRMAKDWLYPFVNISDDGHRCVCKVKAPSIGAAGTRELRLKADIILICGANEKTTNQKNISLKPGTELTVGPVLMKVGKPVGFGGRSAAVRKGETRFQLNSEVKPDAIKSLAFIGPDGKEIEHNTMGSGSRTSSKKSNHWTIYSLHGKVDRVTVRATYYDSIERVSVPVDMNVGVGLL